MTYRHLGILAWLISPALVNGQAKPSSSLADMIDSVKPSVVTVFIKIELPVSSAKAFPEALQRCFHGDIYCVVGAGFVVNTDADIITAFHVVDGVAGSPGVKQVIEQLEGAGLKAHMVVGIPAPNVETTGVNSLTMSDPTVDVPASVAAIDPPHDLALIKPAFNPFTALSARRPVVAGPEVKKPIYASVKAVTLSVARPRDGEEVFACGHPFGDFGLNTSAGTVSSAWNWLIPTRAKDAGSTTGITTYTLDLRINPGNSGGPAFRTSDQAVIGVIVQFQGSLATAIPAKYVTAFLKAHDIPWLPAKEPTN